MENLLRALIELVNAATDYFNVSAELKRRELDTEPKASPKVGLASALPEHTEPVEEPVAEAPGEPAEENMPSPAAPVKQINWIRAQELGVMLGVTAGCITYNASTGRIPCRKDGIHYYFDADWYKDKKLADIQCMAATNRGRTDKERRWRVSRLLEAPIGKCYTHGTSKGAHASRMHQARIAELLHIYTLNGIEYVNLNEAKRYADWWDREKHTPFKADAADFSGYKDEFCVHENDLIWLYTKDYNAQVHPTPQQVEDFRKIFGDLRFIQENGVHFYKKDAIKKVERMTALLSHVEFVDKKEDK